MQAFLGRLGTLYTTLLTPARLRVEALRIALLLRERVYLRLIHLGARKLHQALAPPPPAGPQEAALSALTAAITTHAEAMNRLAAAVETLAGAQPDELEARTPSNSGVIAALAAAHAEAAVVVASSRAAQS